MRDDYFRNNFYFKIPSLALSHLAKYMYFVSSPPYSSILFKALCI